jgi:hypothetical protein
MKLSERISDRSKETNSNALAAYSTTNGTVEGKLPTKQESLVVRLGSP